MSWKTFSMIAGGILLLFFLSIVMVNCDQSRWMNTTGAYSRCTENLKCIGMILHAGSERYVRTGEEKMEIPPGMTVFDLIREQDLAALGLKIGSSSAEDCFACPKDGQAYQVFPVSVADLAEFFIYEAKLDSGETPERKIEAFPLVLCSCIHSHYKDKDRYMLILYSDGTVRSKTPEEVETIIAGQSLRPIGPSKEKDRLKWLTALKGILKVR